MDRKSIIALVACFVLLLFWFPLVNKLHPPKPLPPGQTNLVSAVGAVPSTNAVPGSPATGSTSTASTTAAQALPAGPVAAATEPEQLIEITNRTGHYTFTSHGGGLKMVELIEYSEIVTNAKAKQTKAVDAATLNAGAPVPCFALNDGGVIQGDGVYELAQIENGVRATKELTNGLSIVKEFRLSTNYLIEASMRIENRSGTPLVLPPHELSVGSAMPLNAQDNGQTVGVLWYNGAKTVDDVGPGFFSKSSFGCIPKVPPAEYRKAGSNVWTAVHNQFFTLAVMPASPAAGLVVRHYDLPRVMNDAGVTNATAQQAYAAAMLYPGATVAPHGAVEVKAQLFAGPKEYQTLARIGDRFNNNIDLVMGFTGFGFFAKPLLLAMNWLHETISLSYGWAIIAITVIIKLIFWPLTQASTRSMKRMQALQPQMKAIQEKYKDDPVKMNRKTMEFMKEHKVSPLGGCLPMLLQIPVFFGFYRMIQSAIELRGEHFLWVKDLSRPDTLFYIPGTAFPFNLLPLLMGVTMFWQARMTPPSPGMDPTQAKIMRYMPLMFMVFLYNFSAGLTLYWTVQNLLTIAQTKLTRANEPATGTTPAPVLTPSPKKRK